MNYQDLNDNELLSYVAEDETATEIIYKKYEPLIAITAKRMFNYSKNTGLEIEDLIQEGMIGLNGAISTFNDKSDVLFYTYAKTCVERRIISLVISANRLKHQALNNSVSINNTDDNDDRNMIEFLFEDKKANPIDRLISIERENELRNKISAKLTDFESQVFELKLNNFNYREIAEILDKKPKDIDNCMQRIKIKVKDTMKELE